MKKTNELITALTNAADNPDAFLSLTSRHVRHIMFSRKELLKLWEVASATVRKSLEKIESVTDELSDKVN